MSVQLRDPTAEIASELRPRQSPLPTLAGKCVALLDIGKMRGDEFIDRLNSPGRPPPTLRIISCSARPIVALARLP